MEPHLEPNLPHHWWPRPLPGLPASSLALSSSPYLVDHGLQMLKSALNPPYNQVKVQFLYHGRHPCLGPQLLIPPTTQLSGQPPACSILSGLCLSSQTSVPILKAPQVPSPSELPQPLSSHPVSLPSSSPGMKFYTPLHHIALLHPPHPPPQPSCELPENLLVSSSPSAPGRGPRTEAGRQGLLSSGGDEGGDPSASTVGSPAGGEQL